MTERTLSERELNRALLARQMLLERAGPLVVATFLKELAAGQEFAEAFQRRFYLSYTDFQAAWQERLRGG